MENAKQVMSRLQSPSRFSQNSLLPLSTMTINTQNSKYPEVKTLQGGNNKNRCKRKHYLGGGRGRSPDGDPFHFQDYKKSRYEADDSAGPASQLSEAFFTECYFVWSKSKSRVIEENWGGDALPE